MKIAITGGMGTGKSTISTILKTMLGAELFDSDEICRQQLMPDQEGMKMLVSSFGDKFLQDNGSLNRAALRDAVFSDPHIKEEVENILHPIVRETIRKTYDSLPGGTKALVAEVPLLYESGMQGEFDVVVVVKVSREISLDRVSARDNLQDHEINRVIDSQLDILEKVSLADYVIDNSGTLASSYLQANLVSRLILCRKKGVFLEIMV